MSVPEINILNFSCLRDATLRISPVTVIIGPQGSGKSLTTKLLYFCSDVQSNFLIFVERGDKVEDYKRFVAKQFAIWFPPSAWGSGRFNINYSAGPLTIRILRRMSGGRPADDVSITFSDWFLDFYEQSLNTFDEIRQKDDVELTSDSHVYTDVDVFFRARELAIRRLRSNLGVEYISRQTFIPAGRAFFTSIGRLVAGFEQSGSLDPVTLRFARLFANIRDRNSSRLARYRKIVAGSNNNRNSFMHKLLGGEIRFSTEAEFLETSDGRKIPFSSLSSGQQELLPMWSLLDYFSEIDERRKNISSERNIDYSRDIIYIEEPEAHLFPSAQSLLMEFLIGNILTKSRNIILTTHSPYIMGKLNVFLKAGRLARRKKKNQEINEIVPRECWLDDTQISAFAIQDRRLMDIIDADGLIDGAYLDDISEEISRDFSKLLLIEAEI